MNLTNSLFSLVALLGLATIQAFTSMRLALTSHRGVVAMPTFLEQTLQSHHFWNPVMYKKDSPATVMNLHRVSSTGSYLEQISYAEIQRLDLGIDSVNSRYPPNLYQILRVSKSATTDEIRVAFRQRVRDLNCHPDQQDWTEEREIQWYTLKEAHTILTDDKQRAAYDRRLVTQRFKRAVGSLLTNTVGVLFKEAIPVAGKLVEEVAQTAVAVVLSSARFLGFSREIGKRLRTRKLQTKNVLTTRAL